MASDYFDFKQFRVYHNKCAMKVGTDSVILGSLVQLTGAETNILDIGTGCGILALMLAQKSTAKIIAIEPDIGAAEQAMGNFENSLWVKKLYLLNSSLQDYAKINPLKFDCIISNPPYFVSGKNISIEDNQRSIARHGNSLPFEELLHHVNLLLTESGKFWLILPFQEAIQFKGLASLNGLFIQNEIQIIPKNGKPVNRVIMAYGKVETVLNQCDFYIRNKTGDYSKEYYEVTREFLL